MRGTILIPLCIITSQVDFRMYSIEAFFIASRPSSYHDSQTYLSMKHDASSQFLLPIASDEKKKATRRNRLISFIVERFTQGYDTASSQRTAQPRLHMRTDVILDETSHNALLPKNPPIFYKTHDSDKIIPMIDNILPDEHDAIISNLQRQSLPMDISRTPSKTIKTKKRPSNHSSYRENVSSTLFDWLLHHAIASRSTRPAENLIVSVQPTRNSFPGIVLQGEFQGNVHITFQKIYLKTLRITGGGTLHAKSVRINIYSWYPTHLISTIQQVLRIGGTPVATPRPRFPSSFKIKAYRVALTNDDILQSSCIRIGLRTLFRRVLKSLSYLAPQDVMIHSVNVLANEKVSCQGTIVLPLGTNLPFEVRSGIRASSRGKILEFPGLEILLSNINIPVIPEVAVYLGENFTFLHVYVNGSSRLVQFSAKAKINSQSPKLGAGIPHYLSNAMVIENSGSPRRDSYANIFYCDAAEWITTICQIK